MEDRGGMISDAHNSTSNDCGEQSSEPYIEELIGDERQTRQAAYRGEVLASDRHQTQDDQPDANAAVERTTRAPCHRERLKEGHLRLVKVLPGIAGDLIHCETQIVPVSTDAKYIPLSYAWGSAIATHKIMLDGRKHMLLKNLWQFFTEWKSRLEQARQEQARQEQMGQDGSTSDIEGYLTQRYMARRRARDRREAKTYWLWVDALCIDQSNMRERMHQVRIMSRIFTGAKKLLVGLDPTNNKVDDSMRWFIGESVGMESPRLRRAHVAGFRDMCERFYWRRLWISQELKSAEEITLMCGSHTLTWDQFDQILSKMARIGLDDIGVMRTPSLTGTDVALMEEARSVKLSAAVRMVDLCRHETPTSLWLLLQVTSHLECSDRRDKVYAILSMVKTGCNGIDADYDLPLPQLMDRVLSNFHTGNQPRSVREVEVHCARLKVMMGLEPQFLWGNFARLKAMIELEPDLLWGTDDFSGSARTSPVS